MQKAYVEQVQQEVSERRKAAATQTKRKHKKPASTELPRVWYTDGSFYTMIHNQRNPLVKSV